MEAFKPKNEVDFVKRLVKGYKYDGFKNINVDKDKFFGFFRKQKVIIEDLNNGKRIQHTSRA